MLSIHPEVKGFGDEDETNCKTDEIDKENMKKFCIFIANQKLENTRPTTKYNKQTLTNFWSKEERIEGTKIRTFSHCNTLVKEKNGVAYKPSSLTYFQVSLTFNVTSTQSVQW